MKEYRVEKPKLGWTDTAKKLEEFLNTHAKEGWDLHSVNTNQHGVMNVVFEREKYR
jgi:hypothetical protein